MRAGVGGWLRRALSPSQATGLVLLALALAVHVLPGDSVDVPWRHDWWDQLHQWQPRDRGDPLEAPAVIVAIDEATRVENGTWPWPRDKLAALVNQISLLGASAIASDIIITEPDPQSPVNLAKDFLERADQRQVEAVTALTTGDLATAEQLDIIANRLARAAGALRVLGDWDNVLRDAMRGRPGDPAQPGVPTVLPIAGVPDLTEGVAGQGCDFQVPPVTGEGDDHVMARGFNAADPPLPTLMGQARGLAQVSLAAIDFDASQDFVVRKVRALQPICGERVLLLGAEGLRMAHGGDPARITPTPTGLELQLGTRPDGRPLSLPTERDGTFWLHFGPLGDREAVAKRYVSAQSLFAEDFDRRLIRDKIVLLAVIDLGRIDERRSPLGGIIWGIEAHVQMIEQIVHGDFLRRPWFLFFLEVALTGLLGIVVIMAVPRAPPIVSLITLPVAIATILGLSYVAFGAGLLIDLATPALGAGAVAVGVIGATLIERDRERLKSEIELQSERADRAIIQSERAALQGELDAAARIQTALLPPDRVHREGMLDLAAYILPARTVGGDFFDHTMIDADHLFFLVADVSGKGADASQFMVLSKTLWKSAALREGPTLAPILAQANAEIVRENAAKMFVTGISGVLNVASGRLVYASAGHDAPVLFEGGTTPIQIERPASPPIGLVDGLSFPTGEVTLAPGQRLCLFTDGVTEAMASDGAVFGLDGLLAALSTVPDSTDSAGTIDLVLTQIRAFTAGAAQSDDLTLMVISRPG